MLEQLRCLCLQLLEMARSVCGVARKENVMVRPLHNADGVELHIAKSSDEWTKGARSAFLAHA